jgi:nucleoside-diphosphate-sugar epimerase
LDKGVREKAVQGCKFIIHCAAETSQSKIHFSDYYKNNVEVTDLLYKIAIDSGVKRIIHVSTSNVFGFGNLMNLGNENIPVRSPFTNSLYVQSKIASQNLALSYADKVDIIIVNPTFLIGPFDQKPSSGRIIIHGYGKRIIFILREEKISLT